VISSTLKFSFHTHRTDARIDKHRSYPCVVTVVASLAMRRLRPLRILCLRSLRLLCVNLLFLRHLHQLHQEPCVTCVGYGSYNLYISYTYLWSRRWSLRRNALLQMVQTKGLSSVCVRTWILRLYDLLNWRSQKPQTYCVELAPGRRTRPLHSLYNIDITRVVKSSEVLAFRAIRPCSAKWSSFP